MPVPYAPYLDLIRKEIIATLMPFENENGRRVANYIHRILTALWISETRRNGIELESLKRYESLIPQLSDILKTQTGGAVLCAELVENIRVLPDYRAAQITLQNVIRALSKVKTNESKYLMHAMAVIDADSHAVHLEVLKSSYIEHKIKNEELQSLTAQQSERLQSYLREKFDAEQSVEIVKSRVIVGGGSKRTYVVELSNSVWLPEAIVVRADYSASVQERTNIAIEYELLKEVYTAGLPTPKPFMLEMDSSVLGSPFIIVSLMEGRNIGDWNVVWEPSREFAVDIAHVLAKLHNLPLSGTGEILPGAARSTKEKIKENLASYEAAWRYHGEPSIAMEQAFIWLENHLDFSEGQRSIIHCDVGCHNSLGKNGRLTALLDWENAEIGNPAQELAYAEPHIRRLMDWNDFLAEYTNAGGNMPSQQNIDFYRMYSSVFSMHFLFTARSFLFSGLSSSVVHAYATQHMFYEFENELKKNVREIYNRY